MRTIRPKRLFADHSSPRELPGLKRFLTTSAALVVVAACGDTPAAPSVDADRLPTASAPIVPSSETIIITDEAGTVIAEALLLGGVDLTGQTQMVERDGNHTLVMTSEMVDEAASAKRGGDNRPTSVHGTYCRDLGAPFGNPGASVWCDQINAVDTPGNGPAGRIRWEDLTDGELTGSYDGPVGCMEVVTPGPLPPQPVPGDILVVSGEFGPDYTRIPIRFYYPDGFVAGVTAVTSVAGFEEGCEANNFSSLAGAAAFLRTVPGFATQVLEGGRLRVDL